MVKEESKDETKTKRKMKFYEIATVVTSIVVLIIVVILVFTSGNKRKCAKAICNESGTICYTYKVDENGKTIKTWQGSCSKK